MKTRINEESYQRLAIVALIFLVPLLLYVRFQSSHETSRRTTSSLSPSRDTRSMGNEFVSTDRSLTLTYPAGWYISFTTPKKNGGEFGRYVQSWTITSYLPDAQESPDIIPPNGVAITGEIMHNEQAADRNQTVECGMKTEDCREMTINSQPYKRAASTLNTGMQIIQVGTIYNKKVYRITATIQTGDNQPQNQKAVEEMLRGLRLR